MSNLWNEAIVVLRAFYSMNEHIRNEESSKMNNQCFHLRKLEKRGKFTPNRHKEESDKN